MREQPWNERRVTAEHEGWFRNLADLHELTNAWLAELKIERAPYLLERGPDVRPSAEVSENFWMLEALQRRNIGPLLDDTMPEDALGRLEHTVWAVQAWTLIHLFENAPPAEAEVLASVLEQASWKCGRRCSDSRWLSGRTASLSLRDSFLAAADCPLSGAPRLEGFLPKRIVARDIQLELLNCPHRIPYAEARPAADLLCRLHAHWMRGFLYALNNNISLERLDGPPSRCTQRWFYV